MAMSNPKPRLFFLLLLLIYSLISAVQRVAMPCSLGCENFTCGAAPCSECLPLKDSGKLATEICYNTPSSILKCTKNHDCAAWQMCTGKGLCVDVMSSMPASTSATAVPIAVPVAAPIVPSTAAPKSMPTSSAPAQASESASVPAPASSNCESFKRV
jgi:hypothetical protein